MVSHYVLATWTGWIAFLAFVGMLLTCVCMFGCEMCVAKKTRTKKDDALVERAHQIHRVFVWAATIAILAHLAVVV